MLVVTLPIPARRATHPKSHDPTHWPREVLFLSEYCGTRVACYRMRTSPNSRTQTGHIGDVVDQIVRMFRNYDSQIKFQRGTI
jgi:hypothetical protein